jgi:hypothetical protein
MAYTLVGTDVPRTLQLRGAPFRWRSEAGKNDVFVPDVCVVGTEAAVRQWLKAHGHAPEPLLAQAFRSGDQTSARFKEAVRSARPPAPVRARARPERTSRGNPLEVMQAFGATPAQSVKLINQRNEEKTSPRKTRLLKKVKAEDDTEAVPELAPKHAAVALKKRLADLKPHQVLDVTHFDPVTGKGARVLARPAPNVKTHVLDGVYPLAARTPEALAAAVALL